MYDQLGLQPPDIVLVAQNLAALLQLLYAEPENDEPENDDGLQNG